MITLHRASGLCVAISLACVAVGCGALDVQRPLRECNGGNLGECYKVASHDQAGITNKDYLERAKREKREAALREKTRQSLASSAASSSPDDATLVAKASLSIIGACTGWQLGTVERSQIMNTAKELFSRQGYDPSSVNWSRAIEVAVQLDKEKDLGCLQ